MKASLLTIALASVATSLLGQSTVQVRAGVSVFGDDPLRFEEAALAGGVYLDIPHEGDAVEGTIHINVRAFRVGLLWIKHDVAYLDVPAMMLFGAGGSSWPWEEHRGSEGLGFEHSRWIPRAAGFLTDTTPSAAI